MIEGVTKFTAQQLDYKRTTRVVQAHNSWYASAQQLLCDWRMLQSRRQTLMIPTTSIVYSDNFQSFFRCLFIHNKQSSHISMTQLTYIIYTTHIYQWHRSSILVPFLFGSLRIKDYLCIAKQKEENDGYKIWDPLSSQCRRKWRDSPIRPYLWANSYDWQGDDQPNRQT